MMIWVWMVLSFQLAWIPPGLSTYHELSAALFTEKMKTPEANFGYSITYEPTSKRLIVSAPQNDEFGDIYSCSIEKRKCTTVPKNITRFDDRYKSNYWLGATVKAGSSYFVTCAPLTIGRNNYRSYTRKYNLGIFSRCYKYTDPNQLPITIHSLTTDQREQDTEVFEQTMTTLGWSIDIASNDDVTIGGPAMFTGRAVKYSDTDKEPVSLTGRTYDHEVDYNFGYSVVTGYFLPGKILIYAIGSPYGKFGYGKVSFYRYVKKNMVHVGELSGTEETVGGMFGAVLCAARLTAGSESTALLVGAPTYSTKHSHNIGAVFVYDHAKKARKPVFNDLIRTIDGYQEGSRFGSAIVNVGDLNGDGLDEIVIGAPYEDSGVGAVYLYTSNNIRNRNIKFAPLQRIVPEKKERLLMRSFGLSLTALKDHDGNGCNELAIGAPESNQVKLLRCIASVQVKLREKTTVLRKFKGRSFTFESCLDITYADKPAVVTGEIKVQVLIDHPQAEVANPGDKEYSIFLDRTQNPSRCRLITVNVNQTREVGSGSFMKIDYTTIARLVDPPESRSDFDEKRVAISDISKLNSTGSIWITECNDEKNCLPKLQLVDTWVSEDLPYEIGSTKTLDMKITTRNDGEVAYDPCLRVTFTGASVDTTSSDCDRVSGTEVKCAPKQVVRTGGLWETQPISLQTSHLTTEYDNIKASIKIYNHCTENEKTEIEKTIELSANNNVVINGGTDSALDDYVNFTRTEVTSGKNFDHVYRINNYGNTQWVNVQATVVIQKRWFIENSTITYDNIDTKKYNKNGQECQFAGENDLEATFVCYIDTLHNNSFTEVTVPMSVAPGVLETLIQNNENTVYTQLAIVLIHKDKKTQREKKVTSTLLLKEINVPWWVILIAAIFGLIILVILFFILRSCGFFQRKTKEKLEDVQRSVKRQTIMRKSMIDASGIRLPPGPDRQSLIPPESARQAAAADRRVQI